MPYKSALLVLTLAIVPLLYVSAWSSLGAAIAAYVIAAKLADQQLDRAFLSRRLGRRSALPNIERMVQLHEAAETVRR